MEPSEVTESLTFGDQSLISSILESKQMFVPDILKHPKGVPVISLGLSETTTDLIPFTKLSFTLSGITAGYVTWSVRTGRELREKDAPVPVWATALCLVRWLGGWFLGRWFWPAHRQWNLCWPPGHGTCDHSSSHKFPEPAVREREIKG